MNLPDDDIPTRAFPAAAEGARTSELSGSDSSIFHAERISVWGHFRDLRFLSEGGMGRIYKAQDDTLKRDVALKMLRREDPDLLARFVQEAMLQARVEHPHVCRVYEAGEWRGQSFIAMQFIEGKTLSAMAGSLSFEEKLTVMIQVCEGVHAAHQEGLVHRDLKPTNLMVERTEEGLRAYVLDFGLARAGTNQGLTLTGVVMGTVHYMAPEQARGADGETDRRSDVYALGVCLYELFCGEVPFGEFKGLEALAAQLDSDPKTLRMRVDVPLDLDTVVMKCLEKAPARRYDTARALGDELRRIQSGDPILARRATVLERARRWVRKNRLLFAVGAAGLMLAILAGGMALRERMLATRRAAYAQAFGQEAERIEALSRYAHLGPMHDLAREGVALRERVARLQAAVREGGQVAEAPGAYALGRARLAMGEFVEARRQLERALALGFRSGDLSAALGRTLGALYLRESDQAYSIPSEALREAQLKALERDMLLPALSHLKAGRGATLEPPAYLEALIALYSGRHEEALAQAAAASQASPWFYEADRLAGEVHLQQAHRTSDPALRAAHLEEADRAFRSAQVLAPSDPAILQGRARRWREQMALEWEQGRASMDAFKALAGVCEDLKRLDPKGPEAPILLAWGQVERGRGLELFRKPSEGAYRDALAAVEGLPSETESSLVRAWALDRLARLEIDRGGNALPLLQEASRHADAALRMEPRNLRAFDLRYELASLSFEVLTQGGQDGSSPMEEMLTLAREAPGRGVPVDQAEAWVGYARYHQGDFESHHGIDPRASLRASEQAFRKAIELNPTFAMHFDGLGNALWCQGDYEWMAGRDPEGFYLQAREVFAKGVVKNRRNLNLQSSLTELHLQWARTRLDAGKDAAEALRAAQEWIQDAPEGAWTFAYFRGLLHAGLAVQRARQGESHESEIDQALKEFQIAERMNPRAFQIPVALSDLAIWLLRVGKPDARVFRLAVSALKVKTDVESDRPELGLARARLGLHGGVQWAGSLSDPAQIQNALTQARSGNGNLEGLIQALPKR